MAIKEVECTLVLLGNIAVDDPEGDEIYESLLDSREERIIISAKMEHLLMPFNVIRM